ncbi:MAG TPA: class I SAM-dependent methyltransferase [Nitrososphaerales archaeon]|nr:class I SAM-dependent methyltransferase [Nitrososphaerales archaeon]
MSGEAGGEIPDYENYDYAAQWRGRTIEDRAEKETVISMLGGARDCLELGGGFGRLTSVLEPRVETLVMVDFAFNSLRSVGRRLRKAMLLRSDIRVLPFADDSFDLVLAVRVLHHVREPRLVLDEVVRVARPGGTVIMGIANPNRAPRGPRGGRMAYVAGPNHVSYVQSFEDYRDPRLALVEVRGTGAFDNRLGRTLDRVPALSKVDVLSSRAWFLKPLLFLRYRVRK